MNRHRDSPHRSRRGGLTGGAGIAVAMVVCCGVKLLLLGGVAAGITGGLLRWWPLLVAGTALVAWGLWPRARRDDGDDCASPAPSHDHSPDLHGDEQASRSQHAAGANAADTLESTGRER